MGIVGFGQGGCISSFTEDADCGSIPLTSSPDILVNSSRGVADRAPHSPCSCAARTRRLWRTPSDKSCGASTRAKPEGSRYSFFRRFHSQNYTHTSRPPASPPARDLPLLGRPRSIVPHVPSSASTLHSSRPTFGRSRNHWPTKFGATSANHHYRSIHTHTPARASTYHASHVRFDIG